MSNQTITVFFKSDSHLPQAKRARQVIHPQQRLSNDDAKLLGRAIGHMDFDKVIIEEDKNAPRIIENTKAFDKADLDRISAKYKERKSKEEVVNI